MPNPYPLLYGVGFTPWDQLMDDGPVPDLLATMRPGRALDAGCGTGALAVRIAQRGWDVTGIDAVAKPLARARARAEEVGVADRTRFLKADVAQLDGSLGAGPFDLVTDVGCLHGLTPGQQRTFAGWVTAHTGPGSHLVVLAVMPRRGIGPRGIDEPGLVRLFDKPWSLVSATDAPQSGAGPLRAGRFRWYTFAR